MKRCNLIVPIAADKPEYESHIPYVFRMDDSGTMYCVKAILGLELSVFENIYIAILKKHDVKYGVAGILKLQIERLKLKNVHICVLEQPTRNQAETIYQTIKQKCVHGAIYIKDSDGYFKSEVVVQNGVAVCPIEKLKVLKPQNKSYVTVDNMFYITNIIEKRVIGHMINVGGYCFEDADVFCNYFERLIGKREKLYLSNIVFAMLLDRHVFRPTVVTDYEDWEDTELVKMNKLEA